MRRQYLKTNPLVVCVIALCLVGSPFAKAIIAPTSFSVPCSYLETCRTKLNSQYPKSNLTYYSCTPTEDKHVCTCAPQMQIKCPEEVGHHRGRFITRSTSDSSTCDDRAIEMVKNHPGCCARHTYDVTHVTTDLIPIFGNSSCGIDVRSVCTNWDNHWGYSPLFY